MSKSLVSWVKNKGQWDRSSHNDQLKFNEIVIKDQFEQCGFVYFQVHPGVQSNMSWSESESLVRTRPQVDTDSVRSFPPNRSVWIVLPQLYSLSESWRISPFKVSSFTQLDFLLRSPLTTSCFSSGTKHQRWLEKRRRVKHLKLQDFSWPESVSIDGDQRTSQKAAVTANWSYQIKSSFTNW